MIPLRIATCRSGRQTSLAGLSVRLIALLVATACVLLWGESGCSNESAVKRGSGKEHEAVVAHPLYACPMHPEVTSDKPDQRCPKCGMLLTPVESGVTDPAATERPDAKARSTNGDRSSVEPGQSSVAKSARYHCPMHPTYISDKPGDCPICGMRLVPIEDEAGAESGHESAASSVSGMAPIKVTEEGLRLAGVRTAPATVETIRHSIRTVGTVVPDESRVRHVQTKVTGWIEELHVNATGQSVRRGERILALYSPELLASQEEFLRAKETAQRLTASSSDEVRSGGESLLDAARERLLLFDVPESFIDELERTGKPSRTVPLIATVSGYVTAKGAFEGAQVGPGMELFTVTDLSRVWVEASLYESDASILRPGLEAELTLPFDKTVRRQGRVDLVYPEVDTGSRTLRVRFAFDNPDMALKPGMYVNIDLVTESAEGVVIPDNAVMDTGTRQVAFVRTAPDRFEPREVTVGFRGDGMAQVLSGLAPGEEVVIRANFLLDSESRLRAALAGAGGTSPAPSVRADDGSQPAGTPKHQHGGGPR